MSDTSIPPDPDEDTIEIPDDVTSLFLGDDFSTTAEFVPPEEVSDLPPEDITDGMSGEDNVIIGDGSCVVCGAPTFRPPGLTKAGHKKRAPKYCDLHATNRKIPNERSVPDGMANVAFDKIQGELSDDLKLLAVMAGPLLPVTGMYVWENADSFTLALLKLCKNNPRAIRILHRAAQVAPIYEVAKDAAGVAYAIQVDMKKQDPHNMIGQRLGVARAFDTVYPDSTPSNGNSVRTNGTMGPPRYVGTQ